MLPLVNSWWTSPTIHSNKIDYDSPNKTCKMSMDADIKFNGKMLEMFQPVSDLDPLLTWLLKQPLAHILPPRTTAINRSMDGSVMPLCLKRNPVA